MSRQLDLRNIDLNLLPILDALLEAECVTLASKRVHLSQSATSSALKRLRDTFDDPILIRDGQKMKPSPMARAIRDDLRQDLKSLASIITNMSSSGLADSGGEVLLSASDYTLGMISPLIQEIMRNKARSVKLSIVQFSRANIFGQLKTGEVELAIGAFDNLDKTFRRQRLFTEELAVYVRADHPALEKAKDGRMDIETFTEFSHMVVAEDCTMEDVWISRLLNALGIERKVEVVVPSSSVVPSILKSTDLICVGTRRAHKLVSDGDALACLKPPQELGISEFDVELVWSEHLSDDPLVAWLRQEIIRRSAEL